MTRLALVSFVCLTAISCSKGATGTAEEEDPGSNTNPTAADPQAPATDSNIIPAGPIPVPQCVTGVNANVNIMVTTKTGPKGAAAPVPITNALYSMGIDDRTPVDFVPNPNATYVAYLKAIKPGMLRFPAGVNGQHYTWKASGAGGYPSMTPTFFDQFMALCKEVGAEPFVAVNIETAGVSDAVALVTYANVTKKYGVKWWQIGNEPNLPGEWAPQTPGGTDCTSDIPVCESPTGHPRKFLQYRSAMLAVDPTIKFVGLESYTGEGIMGQHSEVDWFKPFLAGVGSNADAIAWHYYPLYSGQNGRANVGKTSSATISNLLQENASDWPPAGMNYPDRVVPYMRAAMSSVAPKTQIWVDEFAEDSGTVLNAVGTGDTVAGALWAADIMGRFADQGTDAIFHFIFKAHQPYSGMTFGYTLLDGNNVPRPEYYTFWMMANHFGDRMVATTTDKIATVASHAALRASDGSLRIMLTNKSEQPQAVRLQLADYKPVRAAMFTLSGAKLANKTATINGETLSMANIGQGANAIAPAAGQACTDHTLTVPPASVTLVILTVR